METVWTEGTHYTLNGGSGVTGTLTVETAPIDYTPAAGETGFFGGGGNGTGATGGVGGGSIFGGGGAGWVGGTSGAGADGMAVIMSI